MKTEFELWENDNGRSYVREFIEDQGDEIAFELLRQLEMFQHSSFSELLRFAFVKRLTKELYEIRMKVRGMSYRFLFLRKDEKGILVEAFIKKSQKLPTKHIETAKRRIREIL